MRSSLASIAALALAGCAMGGSTQGGKPSLDARTFGPARSAGVRTLVVVVHGDGEASGRSDHYGFAKAIASAVQRSAAVALLRPGYDDGNGRRSPGTRGAGVGDDYTADRIAAVADAIARLKRRYANASTILVGEAGGAALAANLAGVRPGLIDGLVLVACPCALPEWRRYMYKRLSDPSWNGKVASLDPLKTAGGITQPLRAAVLVGSDDEVTPVKFSRAYAEALTLRGIATDYRIVPGKGHDLLNDPEVLAATERMAAELPGRGR